MRGWYRTRVAYPPARSHCIMGKAQEFSIKAPSEDPKKNEKPGEEPDKAEGSSKLLGTKKIEDGKEGEGEELVCFWLHMESVL